MRSLSLSLYYTSAAENCLVFDEILKGDAMRTDHLGIGDAEEG
jgi:hypothetical protein